MVQLLPVSTCTQAVWSAAATGAPLAAEHSGRVTMQFSAALGSPAVMEPAVNVTMLPATDSTTKSVDGAAVHVFVVAVPVQLACTVSAVPEQVLSSSVQPAGQPSVPLE